MNMPAANWYPDPSGKHEHRYWDGAGWTEHVSDHGRQSIDPIGSAKPVPTTNDDSDRIRRQVQERARVDVAEAGGGTLFTEPVLVVNQKAKLIEIHNEYAVFDQHGSQVAAVRQVGQSAAKKVLRVLTSLDQFMTHSLQIVDMGGNVLLTVTRPAKFFKSTVEVGGPHGETIGRVVQQNMFGKIRFAFEVDGETIGSMHAENWRAWNFSLQDRSGTEVARITKTWEGLAKTLFTTADNYVLQIDQPVAGPLRTLVVASALVVDTALKQDQRGFG
ncbi:MAG: DUF2510 domain-containing protein [Acidimicrobiales bacterium]|nr:DUF2510 domain-containing protein [Acidimicrobiales bacterium]